MLNQRERVFSEMKGDILNGTLKPGDPISERAYSKRANVSRVPVREALIQLEGSGLVTYKKALGAFVRVFEIDDIRELYEVRENLEGAATRSAVGRMEKAVLNALEARLLAFTEAKTEEQRHEIRRANTELHDAILQACGNSSLQRILGAIREQITLSRVWRFAYSSEGAILGRVEEHVAIIRAIHDGDGVSAETLMRAHIAGWRKIHL